MTELTLNPRVAQWTVQSIVRTMAAFAILQGLNIIFSGVHRWSSDAFAIALLLPGAPPTWGVVVAAGGSLMMFGSLRGRYRPVSIGAYICAGWSVFFALTFIVAASINERASTTGAWAYGAFTVLFVLLGVAYQESRKTRGHRAVHSNNT